MRCSIIMQEFASWPALKEFLVVGSIFKSISNHISDCLVAG